MNVSLDQLDNNESILLMYLADELSPADRAEVERRLSVDENLRTEYEQLVAANDLMQHSFGSLDALQPLPGTSAAMERQMSRMIRQWQTDRMVAKVAAPAKVRPNVLRRYWWMYPAAAAAAVLAFFIWWGIQQPSDQQQASSQPSGIQQPEPDPGVDNDTPPRFSYATNVSPNVSSLDDASDTKELNDVEKELDAVHNLQALTQ